MQGAFLDISAAFDKVWHQGLLAKLDQIGINGKLFDLFTSYLINRKQCVVIEGVKSNLANINAGVPQGSRLGPLLFILYINDIVSDLESEILIFADDTTLLASGKDPTETSIILNRDLSRISEWAEKWQVIFNPKKSKDMIFTNKMLNNSPPLEFNNVFIERVNKHKHLGVYLTPDLSWSTQVHEICLKAIRKLSVLRSVKYLKRKTLDLLYKVTVRSLIDYALPVYGNNLKLTDINRLEQLQYRAAKLVTGALPYTSREKLNKELGWESIQKRIEYLGLSIFHKIHVGETRPLLRKCLTPVDWDRYYNLRRKGGYLPYPKYGNKFSNSFFPYITKIWNSLPSRIQSLNLKDFKTELKNYLKPHNIRHFRVGNKELNSIFSRFRTGRTGLNADRYSIMDKLIILLVCVITRVKHQSILSWTASCILLNVRLFSTWLHITYPIFYC